jgi:uncharacterized protein YoxC
MMNNEELATVEKMADQIAECAKAITKLSQIMSRIVDQVGELREAQNLQVQWNEAATSIFKKNRDLNEEKESRTQVRTNQTGQE